MSKTPQSHVRILIHIEQTTSGNKSMALNMRYEVNFYKDKSLCIPIRENGKGNNLPFTGRSFTGLRRSPVYVRTSTGIRLDEVFFDSSRSCKWNGERDHLFTSLDFSRSPSLFRSVTRFRGF